MAFDNGVATPGGASFNAPEVSFDWLKNLPNDYFRGVFNQQQRGLNDQSSQLNAQRIEDQKRTLDASKAFPNGLPIDPRTGQVDYSQVASTLAKFGDVSGAMGVMAQQPPAMSPMFGGQGQPAPQGAPAGGQTQAAPAARPASPPLTAKGDSGSNTITSLVTDKLPSQNQTTGATIGKIAEVMGLDPNADLTAGQLRRAQGLLQKYAPEVAGTPAGGGGGNLPPSANAGTPAPSVQPLSRPSLASAGQPAPNGAPSGQAPQQQLAPQAQPQPQQQPPQAQPQQQPQGQPITPQVPLPQGFNDPQKAIQALRTEAARIGGNPRGQAQAQELNNWANRIEESIKPLAVQQNTTLVDPRTGKTLYQGPGAAALAQSAGGAGSPTLDADAELYRQTGKLPPNMGRGVQGNAEARRIRERAGEQEIEQGGNPAEWPTRWQSFGAQAAGKKILASRQYNLTLTENEASSLLPRVREASAKVKRTEYPTLNKLIEAGQQGRGGTDVVKLGIAVASLVPVYARVLKPVGQITEGDTHRALEILDKAWSDGQINAALDQMEVEMKSARSSLDKTMKDFDAKPAGGKADDNKPQQPAAAGKASADGWTVHTLPNGSKARVQEVTE